MISCYALLALYLSKSGSLNVQNLDHSYVLLKQEHVVSGTVNYEQNGNKYEDMFMITDKELVAPHKFEGDETQTDKCELKKVVYYGAFNHYQEKKYE